MDPLDVYRSKRDFHVTREPEGNGTSDPQAPVFVVQRHHASRLHYDFRLEAEGVLKSWAVPKGPSLDPNCKRLAVPTEDHPLSYADFEGEIPKGEYGGGQVVLWDRGTWKCEGDSVEQLKRGKLSFELEGHKLRGGFSLIRMKDGNWLLRKRNDQAADPDVDIVNDRPESVLPASAAVIPTRLEPMLCKRTKKPPTGPGWVHELKLDGYRLVCRASEGEVRFYSRNGIDWTSKVGRLAKELAGFEGTWLDGELVTFDGSGVSHFADVRAAVNAGRDAELVYMVFDAPFLDGVDLRDVPLIERKARLRERLDALAPTQVRYVDHMESHQDEGAAFLELACQAGAEGIVSKRTESGYRERRSADWLKVKCLQRTSLRVAGYVPLEGDAGSVGALVLATDDLRFAGKVGTGFSDAQRRELAGLLDGLAREDSPLAEGSPPGRDAITWAEPELHVDVSFMEWTETGRLRHPVFQGLAAGDGVKTRPARKRPSTKVRSAIAGVKLSNVNKVLYPDAGITKGELAEHAARVAEWMLPHVERRPLTLLRCPDGIGKCFFQKHAGVGVPSSVEVISLPEKQGRGDYLFIRGVEGLVALVQLGVLEVHLWGSRVDRSLRPDRMVIDLDPAPDVTLVDLVGAAVEVHERLEALGIVSFPMLTGGKGLHVVAPLDRHHDFALVKRFTKALATRMTADAPKRFIAKSNLSARTGKIFVDYLRNGHGATAVAPYSTRARPGAPVALPISWSDLGGLQSTDDVTVRTLAADPPRDDPWDGYFELRQRITVDAMRALGMKG